MSPYIRWFRDIRLADVASVGGKTASLGELHGELARAGVRVPDGFAITTEAYRALLETGGLPPRLAAILREIAISDPAALARAGTELRRLVEEAPLPAALEEAIRAAYRTLAGDGGATPVAVRSSATAEDLPEASFAGQHESVLDVRGPDALVAACRRCWASIFTDRAIVYRAQRGIDHMSVLLSIAVQRMVAAERGVAGVMFTLDPDSGFGNVVLVNAAYGLGEAVVQGQLDPDEFWLFKPALRSGRRPLLRRRIVAKRWKLGLGADGRPARVDVAPELQSAPSLTEAEVVELGGQALAIEAHYSARAGRPMPMDIEFARDGDDGRLYVLQARPETVHRGEARPAVEVFSLAEGGRRERLVSGVAVGQRIGAGPVRRLAHPGELARFRDGEVLVAAMTDPDWEPVMKRAAAVVTDRGGRTCHAAIVSRELGVPCVVGTGDASRVLTDQQLVTVSCAEGETGHVYRGRLPFARRALAMDALPRPRTRVMINVGNPGEAFRLAALPCDGVGLARIEFIIGSAVRVHPLALLHPERVEDPRARDELDRLVEGYGHPAEYFVERLAEGVATIAAAFAPREVVVRLSDFKSNEYAGLVGGRAFEPVEGNPMLGFRGAYRYAHPRYREAFALECRAMRRVREEMGLTNVKLMIPFCRTPDEGRQVLELMAAHGLRQGDNGLEVYVMCEIPSNVILAREFAELFDGFSIGSNDLTQLVLGVDRDSELVAPVFDERNPAVLAMLGQVIEAARGAGRAVGICGQAPSDYPELVRFLVQRGITSISLNPDAFVRGLEAVAAAEAEIGGGSGRHPAEPLRRP